ncbi:MAG: MiaB/RimO family radical SAM methylthiotransferase [Synergistaceae bacterium]|nr:MiaB/RimO family radical SAM methylthiotransferase [Synergistaceae bacterium]
MQSHQSMGIKIFVHVFGCRSNLCEGEYIAGALKSNGAEITENINDDFNAAVIISCSVTQEAGKKCRQLVKRVRKILGSEGILAVCGCWSQSLDSNMAEDLGINILSGSKGKNILPDILLNAIKNHDTKFQDLREKNIFDVSEWEELEITQPVMHSRAFIKIQDGCDHFCTYCIIPFLRGRPVSRPVENIISEIKRLIDNGCKEIIFTGIHLGIYGRDINSSLSDLIKSVSKIKSLKRLRLGSLEPFCLDENLINALSDCEMFCHHLHLPLQSGDDEILSSMRRGYKAKEFLNVCYNARKKISDRIHISSDILVGFPNESENAFNNTLKIMREANLGRVHVFPYSVRNGTLAAKMENQIPHETKIFRTSEAIKLGHELYENYAKSFVNHDVEILIEKNNKGHTRNYIDAYCEGNENEIIKAKAVKYVDNGLECLRRN